MGIPARVLSHDCWFPDTCSPVVSLVHVEKFSSISLRKRLDGWKWPSSLKVQKLALFWHSLLSDPKRLALPNQEVQGAENNTKMFTTSCQWKVQLSQSSEIHLWLKPVPLASECYTCTKGSWQISLLILYDKSLPRGTENHEMNIISTFSRCKQARSESKSCLMNMQSKQRWREYLMASGTSVVGLVRLDRTTLQVCWLYPPASAPS